MLGYKKAKEKGKRVYSDPLDPGPQNVEEWREELIIVIVILVAAILVGFLFTKFYTL